MAPPTYQLRMDLGSSPAPRAAQIEVSGLRVHVTWVDPPGADIGEHLRERGIDTSVADNRVVFAAADLPRLAAAAPEVEFIPAGDLVPLFDVITHPPVGDRPLLIDTLADGSLDVSWFDGADDRNVVIPPSAAPALTSSGLPFIASNRTWEVLLSAAEIPPRVGSVSFNPDGFYEVRSSAPQLVESAPIPGLFRLSDSVFGFPFAAAADVWGKRGFRWEGERPALPNIPIPPLPLRLRRSVRRAASELAGRLSVTGGEVVAWDSGTGRRVGVVAALEALDAFPAVVVCPPWAVWLWQRHLSLFGRVVGIRDTRNSDVVVTTYHDLALRTDPLTPVSIIVDHPETVPPKEREAVRTLVRAYPDAYRVGIVSGAEVELEDLTAALSVVRPAEFEPTAPQVGRYFGDREANATYHAHAYTMFRSVSGRPDDSIRRSSVLLSSPPEELSEALWELRQADLDPQLRLARALDIVSAGTQGRMSPKLAQALRVARAEAVAGRTAAVVTTSRRSLTLLSAALSAVPCVTVDSRRSAAELEAAVTRGGPLIGVVLVTAAVPDLSDFHTVVFCDYPWNTALVEVATGSASAELGPRNVLMCHMEGTTDDRLAVFSALRSEAGLGDPAAVAPPDRQAILHLLAGIEPPRRS